jgi:hypothetical protein
MTHRSERIQHTHLTQGAVEGCPACATIRPESQVHPHLVPALPSGYVPTSLDQEPKTVYPPLTATEFAEGAGYEFRGVPIVEDEGADYVFAYGHVEKVLYAAVVNDYDAEMQGFELEDLDALYTAADVEHRWAVTTSPADGPDGWYISWADEYQEHAQRFPVTVVNR